MRARFDAAGDVIVVTGGANGIGLALARAAAQAGARVVVCDVDAAAMATLASVAGISTRRLDVSDRAAVFEVLGGVERDFGKIDGLVWCYQAVVAGMIARRSGSIIAFTSGLAHQGWPGASAYAASKAALIAFAKSAAKEIARHRVRFNLVAPGVIDTPQYRVANAGDDECPLACIGRRRTARGRRRPAPVLVVRCGDDDRFDHQPGLRLCGAGRLKHERRHAAHHRRRRRPGRSYDGAGALFLRPAVCAVRG